MMALRYFALVAGIVYALVGILGFVPGVIQTPPPDAPALTEGSGYGYLLGLFPVNLWHNVVHLVVGVIGVIAWYQSVFWSRQFARGLAVFYGLLTVMGLIPQLSTVFGFIPIFGHNIWLHGLTAIVAAYFGWLAQVHLEEPAAAARIKA